ncbi:MAG: hypothetical protein K1X79_09130 [Oligoflexia bacterium]|nr:hypothetical protein [Oligoflexia bacterium]
MARVQRQFRVELCHVVWMGNHVHMLVVPYDTQDCIDFYQEIQKKLTEAIKRLLGEDYLRMWEGDPVVMEIGDLEAAIEKIAYIYGNPSHAHLVDSIEEYPGVSTWGCFSKAACRIDYIVSREVPWVQLPSIGRLPSRAMSESMDRSIAGKLRSSAKLKHRLEYSPNAWMRAFGIKDEAEIALVNRKIAQRVADREVEARNTRKKAGFGPLGVKTLRRQAVMTPHVPKKRERRMFIYTSIRQLRMEFIQARRMFCELCRMCYIEMKAGNMFPPWPVGAIRPYLPPLATAL